MRFASRTRRLEGEGADAWIVHDRAVARLRQGEDIYLLSIGDPDFETPAPIRRAAVEALAAGRTHYSPSGGEPALRAIIAARARVSLGVPRAARATCALPSVPARSGSRKRAIGLRRLCKACP